MVDDGAVAEKDAARRAEAVAGRAGRDGAEMLLVVRGHRRGPITVVTAVGQVDLLGAATLRAAVEEARAAAAAALIVDLTAGTFLAAVGIAVLRDVHRDLASVRPVALVATGPAVLPPLRLLGLTELLSIHPTVDAVTAALSSGGSGTGPR